MDSLQKEVVIIFIVKDGRVITPEARDCLVGILETIFLKFVNSWG